MFHVLLLYSQTRYLTILMAVVCCFLFLSCDNGRQETEPQDTSTSKGQLEFEVIWPQNNADSPSKSALSGDICVDLMIERVLGVLYDANDTQIKTGDWACEKHSGTLEAPYGSGYRVVLQGTVAGNVVWEGQISDIDVIEGVPNDPIVITMTYVGEDIAPPAVIEAIPEDGATEVSTETTIRLTFGESIAGGSVDGDNFHLVAEGDGADHPCDFAYNPNTQSVTITPKTQLAQHTNYQARISIDDTTVVQDLAGNRMNAAFEWQFSTGAHANGPPAILSFRPGNETVVVSLSPAIEAVFDQPMDSRAIVATNVILYDSSDTIVDGQVEYNTESMAAAFIPASALQPNSVYRVLISGNVTNADGMPMGSDVAWTFTTTGSSMDLIQPSNNGDVSCDNVAFQWSEVRGADAYHLQVASDSEFQQIVTDVMVTGTHYQLDQAHIGTNYWRVQAQDASQNHGTWSAVWQFNGSRTRWFQRFGSPGEDDANGLAISHDDGIIITGRTYGVIDLPGSADTYQYQGGQGDIFLLKMDAAGNGVWIENLGTSSGEDALAVATDANNDIYITGFCAGDLGQKAHENAWVLLSRFSSNGNLRWARQYSEDRGDTGNGIATRLVKGAVQILITGVSEMPLPGIDSSRDNIFLAQFDSDGNQAWWKMDGTEGYDGAYAVLTDQNDNAVVCGGEDGRLNLISYNAAQERNWTADLGAMPDLHPYVKGALHEDNVYVAGTLRNDPAVDRVNFVGKYNAADGNLVWQHRFQITEDANYEYGKNVAVDQNGDIYVTGIYILDPLAGSTARRKAVYVSKFEPANGDLIWRETLGGTDAWEYAPSDIKVDSQGNIIVIGYNYDDPQSYPSFDIFVWKLSGRNQ